MAREKCRKAVSTSDLNSEMSAGEQKNRIIKKRQLSSPEDDEYSYRLLPTPPPLKGLFKYNIIKY